MEANPLRLFSELRVASSNFLPNTQCAAELLQVPSSKRLGQFRPPLGGKLSLQVAERFHLVRTRGETGQIYPTPPSPTSPDSIVSPSHSIPFTPVRRPGS